MSNHDRCIYNCGGTDCYARERPYQSVFDKLCEEYERENPEQWEKAGQWARMTIAKWKIRLQPFY